MTLLAKKETARPLIYLVIAVPGSGKTWVCRQLVELFEYVPHDDYLGPKNVAYVSAIVTAARAAQKPLLTEAPFSVSEIKEPLERAGFPVIPVFIFEEVPVILDRYWHREGGKAFPKQHLTRMQTYRQRCWQWQAFGGTSEEVLAHLKALGTNFKQSD